MAKISQIIKVDKLSFSFDSKIEIIKEITFSAKESEFISITGPSGCGKSTLLRCIAGLIAPTKGEVLYMNDQIIHPISEISFVFQDFALLPWLTNIENVKLGLSSANIEEDEKEKRATEMLAKLGLEGSENAYPNTLSGGMRQRVGIARAIVSDPQILLMDEPFSSLDDLTANILREDVMQLLKGAETSVKTVIMVTHNIEEAVELSDKIVVLSNKPSEVKKIIVNLGKYPRNKRSKNYDQILNRVYSILTTS